MRLLCFLLIGCPNATPVGPPPDADSDADTDTDTDTDTDADSDADADADSDADTDTGTAPQRVVVLPNGTAPSCGTSPVGQWFDDVTLCAGTHAWHVLPPPGGSFWYATGQGFADIDGDSWLDLVITSMDGGNRLFLGSPNGTFTERIEPALSGKSAGPLAFIDYDNDGDQDLYLGGKGEGWLLENTGSALVEAIDGPSNSGMAQGVSFGDLNGDGSPELYVGQYQCDECFPAGSPIEVTSGDQLFSLSAAGSTEFTDYLGTPSERSGLGFIGAFSDFDGDGDQDLVVLNDRGGFGPPVPGRAMNRNVYFRNDGPGCNWWCFTEMGLSNGLDLRIDAMGFANEDVDRDGDLDLLITDTSVPSLLVNQGNGLFLRHVNTDGLTTWRTTWGVAFVDIDNDADLDVITASTGSDILYLNDGDGQFTDISLGSGVEDGAVTYGLSVADYDRDGRVDVVLGDRASGYRLLRNIGSTTNHWVGLRLVGDTSAGGKSALGARVSVLDTNGITQVRVVQSGTSMGGGSDLGLHFGLGTADLANVTIRWPDGTEEVFQPSRDHWNVLTRL